MTVSQMAYTALQLCDRAAPCCPEQATLDVGDATRDGTERLSRQLQGVGVGVQDVVLNVRTLQHQVRTTAQLL